MSEKSSFTDKISDIALFVDENKYLNAIKNAFTILICTLFTGQTSKEGVFYEI